MFFLMNLRQDLETRGFLNQFTDEKLFDMYNQGGQSFYVGYDPSADSLQLGNMCTIMAAVNLMKYGNKCFFLVGGATGMIGDPSGRDSERSFLSEEKLRSNEAKIHAQIKSFLTRLHDEFGVNFEFEMVNNYDFYKNMNFLQFLGEVGKYITVNYMAAKESVKKRLTDPDKSISYTEFSYMLIQGYDFCKLYQDKGVKLQLGGSDQWGNVTTGIEITRKKLDAEVYGLTIPLITDASGKKFGKSE
ncbi:TPA: tyrosine--tRNA ligase [Patescibacteria group bacterium]|nr:tyrosine--tRNA ligase [Candidatus Gracilibacteria bacterium]